MFFLIYNHYCFSALVNTAEIRVSIIHAQLSKTVHGDQFTSKLLLIRTRNSKGQCDNYDFHYRQINTLFHCSQLLSISSKCMSGNFFFFCGSHLKTAIGFVMCSIMNPGRVNLSLCFNIYSFKELSLPFSVFTWNACTGSSSSWI